MRACKREGWSIIDSISAEGVQKWIKRVWGEKGVRHRTRGNIYDPKTGGSPSSKAREFPSLNIKTKFFRRGNIYHP